MAFEIKPPSRKTSRPDSQAVFRQREDPEMWARFVAVVERSGVSRSEALRQCVRYALDNMNEKRAAE